MIDSIHKCKIRFRLDRLILDLMYIINDEFDNSSKLYTIYNKLSDNQLNKDLQYWIIKHLSPKYTSAQKSSLVTTMQYIVGMELYQDFLFIRTMIFKMVMDLSILDFDFFISRCNPYMHIDEYNWLDLFTVFLPNCLLRIKYTTINEENNLSDNIKFKLLKNLNYNKCDISVNISNLGKDIIYTGMIGYIKNNESIPYKILEEYSKISYARLFMDFGDYRDNDNNFRKNLSNRVSNLLSLLVENRKKALIPNKVLIRNIYDYNFVIIDYKDISLSINNIDDNTDNQFIFQVRSDLKLSKRSKKDLTRMRPYVESENSTIMSKYIHTSTI